MKELVYITMEVYFEISDSYVYGGIGTKGYASPKFGGINLEKLSNEIIFDEIIEETIDWIAEFHEVPKEKVRVISQKEFDEETEDNTDDGFDDFVLRWQTC